MSNARFKTGTASFLYEELQSKVSAPTLAFICNSVDAASLDAPFRDSITFPRDIATVSMVEIVHTAFNDPRSHYTVDLYDRQRIPVGSIRIYLEGDCRLLREASDETMLMYKARIGLL